MANGGGLPTIPDPATVMNAGVTSIQDMLNTGVRSINDIIGGIGAGATKAASSLNLPAIPMAVPPIPEFPNLSQGLPTLPAGLPLPPGLPGMGGGGGGGGGGGAAQQKQPPAPAAGSLGYGERTGGSCIRLAGASSLGYGES